jgi:hypothetical protein
MSFLKWKNKKTRKLKMFTRSGVAVTVNARAGTVSHLDGSDGNGGDSDQSFEESDDDELENV